MIYSNSDKHVLMQAIADNRAFNAQLIRAQLERKINRPICIYKMRRSMPATMKAARPGMI